MTMTTDGRSALPAGNVTTLPAARTGRNMMSIASGKGGVGKTWFAITLSQALARLGRRILLFDGDLGLANVDIQLGLMPSRDLASVLDGAVRSEEHTSELQSLMRISYAVFCLKKKKHSKTTV